MSTRRDFRYIANGIADAFEQRNNDVNGYWGVGVICQIVQSAGASAMVMDLMTASSSPRSPAGNAIAARLHEWVSKQMLIREMPPTWLVSAQLEVVFVDRAGDRSVEKWPLWVDVVGGRTKMFRFDARATITDDRGRAWVGISHGWCWQHDPSREQQSIRAVKHTHTHPAS